MQSDFAWPTVSLVVLAALSVAADWWRHRRRETGRFAVRTGWVPWPLITILSLVAAAYCAALWLRGA